MGEGGILFDPVSVDELRSSLDRVIHDEELRSELKKRGFVNIKRFSWEKCARETYQIYKDVL
jgi:glycosyltransferase involved in cell wall biosynthesis